LSRQVEAAKSEAEAHKATSAEYADKLVEHEERLKGAAFAEKVRQELEGRIHALIAEANRTEFVYVVLPSAAALLCSDAFRRKWQSSGKRIAM